MSRIKPPQCLETESLFNIGQNKLEKTEHFSSIHPDDIERVKGDFQAHLEGKTKFYINKHRVLRKNNSYFWVLSRGKVVSRDKKGKALRMVGIHIDYTERELAALIYRNSSQAMFVCDANNIIISINPAFTAITGYKEVEVLGKSPCFFSSGKHDKAFYQQMWDSINNTGSWTGEIWNKRKNGGIYPEILNINTIKNANGDLDHYVALFTDITEKKKTDELIIKQANYDPLTDLPNRHLFQQSLQHEIDRSNRSKLPLALLFIDLDHFKDINDTHGHDIGDLLLIQVSHRIQKSVRNTDIVARLGGDEFTVILPELKDRHIVERITQKIIDSLKKPFLINSYQIFISASIGITLFPDDAEEITAMQKHADQAMYQAKAKGRNCFSYFTVCMQEEALERQMLTIDLRSALATVQLEIYYQPIVDSVSGIIDKAEALLRWNHPSKGMISPAKFIPVAEETGLIVEIGDWVFKQVAYQLNLWKAEKGINLQVSINMSPVQFFSNANHNHWLKCLYDLDLSGEDIVIEITEGLLLEDDAKISEQFLQFRDAKIEVAIDDFGTGYSALSYLKKFDIDYLKIDQSFVRNLAPESEDMALTEAIIVMAHKLGLKVIAEGVETEQQRQLLTASGSDYLQGYLFSRPVPATDFEKLLENTS